MVPVSGSETIADVVHQIGIPEEELSANVFLDGEYSALCRRVDGAGRLAVFPRNMGLLYSWHFDRAAKPACHGQD